MIRSAEKFDDVIRRRYATVLRLAVRRAAAVRTLAGRGIRRAGVVRWMVVRALRRWKTPRYALRTKALPDYLSRSEHRKEVLTFHEQRNRSSIDLWYQKRDENYYYGIEPIDPWGNHEITN